MFSKWEDAKHHGQGENFCDEFCLSNLVLENSVKCKQQLINVLEEIGLISAEHQCNVNSDDDEVLKATIAAGLYPGVAKVTKVIVSNKKKKSILETSSEKKVQIHIR